MFNPKYQIMKTTLLTVLLVVAGLSVSFAQSPEGSWTMMLADQEGNTFPATLVFTADSYEAEWIDNDKPEVTGTYTMEDGKITLKDSGGEMSCPGSTGIYTVSIEGDKLTMTVVTDDCEGRSAGSPMVMTRKDS